MADFKIVCDGEKVSQNEQDVFEFHKDLFLPLISFQLFTGLHQNCGSSQIYVI